MRSDVGICLKMRDRDVMKARDGTEIRLKMELEMQLEIRLALGIMRGLGRAGQVIGDGYETGLRNIVKIDHNTGHCA